MTYLPLVQAVKGAATSASRSGSDAKMGKTDLGIPRRSKSAKVVLGSETQLDPRTCGLAAWEFGTGSFFMQWTAFGLRKTTIKVSDFIQNCSHPQFTLQMLGASSCPPSPGTEAIQ